MNTSNQCKNPKFGTVLAPDENVLLRIFGTGCRVEVIVFFLEHPFHKYTTNQVADYLGMSKSHAWKLLNELHQTDDQHPLLLRVPGTTDSWKLNVGDDVAQRLIKVMLADVEREEN